MYILMFVIVTIKISSLSFFFFSYNLFFFTFLLVQNWWIKLISNKKLLKLLWKLQFCTKRKKVWQVMLPQFLTILCANWTLHSCLQTKTDYNCTEFWSKPRGLKWSFWLIVTGSAGGQPTLLSLLSCLYFIDYAKVRKLKMCLSKSDV